MTTRVCAKHFDNYILALNSTGQAGHVEAFEIKINYVMKNTKFTPKIYFLGINTGVESSQKKHECLACLIF